MGNDMGKLGNLSGAGSLKHHLETAEKTGALAFPDKKLTEFPAALSKVADKLRNLDLSRNRIRSLPPIIGSFKALRDIRDIFVSFSVIHSSSSKANGPRIRLIMHQLHHDDG